MRRTKIICTIGPATEDKDVIKRLIQSGMDAARLNFSHGNHQEHKKRIDTIREAAEEVNKPIAIILDTKGPEIRIGNFKNGEVYLEKGQEFVLTTEEGTEGDNKRVWVTYSELPQSVEKGSVILLDDGLIELKVVDIREKEVVCIVQNSGILKNKKGVNLPGVSLKLPAVTEKDYHDIIFGIRNEVDYIAASFVRRASDVLEIRRILEENEAFHIGIISKIENREGVQNINEIIKTSDGIMVARGDLGVEIPAEEVPLIQKDIIKKCNKAGKPVITATQMLESMIYNPRPTRAEASDVANAILDGADAVMLSGETAVGKFPVETVRIMSRIAAKAETAIDYRNILKQKDTTPKTITDAIGHATVTTALDLEAAAIISATKSGYTARMISKYRPPSKIIAVTPNEKVLRKLSLTWGVISLLAPEKETTDEMIDESILAALQSGNIKNGDLVVITAGVPVGITGTTNLLRVQIVGDVLIKGSGIGSKHVTAKTFLARTPEEAMKIKEGNILVVKSTDKEYVAALRKAGGIVAEEGGLTSHAAVVGLTLGIPVIVGAEGALEKLSSGLLVTIDPVRGLLYKGKAMIK